MALCVRHTDDPRTGATQVRLEAFPAAAQADFHAGGWEALLD